MGNAHLIPNVCPKSAPLALLSSSKHFVHHTHLRSHRNFVSVPSTQHNIRHSVLNLVSAAAAAGSKNAETTKPAKKRTTTADLKARIEELEAENAALRETLVRMQQMGPTAEAPYCPEMLEDDDGEAGSYITAASYQHSSSALLSPPTPDIIEDEDLIKALENGISWPSPNEAEFYNRPARSVPVAVPSTDAEHLAAGQVPSRPLNIVHVTAEMAPSAKVGGLGDVVTGLSKACIAAGHNPVVILPFYECLPESAIEGVAFDRAFDVPKGRFQDGNMDLSSLKTLAYTGNIEGVPVVLLRPDWESTGSSLFRGGRIYGGSFNETEAYLYFCRAALEYLTQSGQHVDVLHAHEWQCSAVPMLFWEYYSKALPNARPALTIHNMDNTGECRQDEFAATGIDGQLFAHVDKALDERTIGHNPERLCLLKGGIVYSSFVTTVSPTYALETLQGGSAGFLKSTLARPEVANKYFGVLNGIDVTEMWNPAADPHLPACYSALHPQGKALCKKYLQQGFGLNIDPKKPLVAVISRLVPQKGIHLIEHAAKRTIYQHDGQFVLLGTGHASGGLEKMANDEFRDNKDVKMVFGYSETLAHLIYAAADIFLVPSMFEPCGLTQMIALRYGAVPVVRRTGGLADTVHDVDEQQQQQQQNSDYDNEESMGFRMRNGFVFDGVDGGSLDSALDRAMDLYKENPAEWEALMLRNLMTGEQWSWKTSAQSYIELYSGIL